MRRSKHSTRRFRKIPRTRAHWGIAKAFVRKSGYTSISIMTELSGFESASGQNNLLPFMDPFLNPIDKVNLLYEGLIQANEHLQFIHSGQAWSTDLDGDAIALDYTGTLAVEGILLFRDTNSDGHINAQDVNLMAFFDGSGNLSFDPNAWLSVIQDPNQDPEAMLQSALDVLGESSDVLAGIVNDLAGDSIATGIDTENLDVVIEDLLNGVQDYWNNTNP